MGQQQSLIGGDAESVGVLATSPPDASSYSQNIKDTEKTEDESSGDKVTELSFRAAIDKFIESCLTNQPNPETSEEDNQSKAASEMIPVAKGKENKESVEQKSKNTEMEKEETSESSQSLDKAKSFSSFLQMRIRNMIVNCENEEEINAQCGRLIKSEHVLPVRTQSDTKTSDTSTDTSAKEDGIVTSDTSTTVSSASTSVPTLSTNTISTQISTPSMSESVPPISVNVSTSVSAPTTKETNTNQGAVACVPLQTLIDKVLDNSLGSSAIQQTKPNVSSTTEVSNSLLKPKVSYEIAAESAKVVSEKVTRCMEKSVSSSDNSVSSKSENAGICLLAHIEKVLERNFAQLCQMENEENADSPLPVLEEVNGDGDKLMDTGVTSESAVSTSSRISSQSSANVSKADGSISVQDIVDRVISQTEVISKLLTTSTTSKPLNTFKECVSVTVASKDRPIVASDPYVYERNIVKAYNSSKAKDLRHGSPKSGLVGKHVSYDPNEMQQKHYPPTSRLYEHPDRKFVSERMLHNKHFPPGEVGGSHFMDSRTMINDAHRQKLIQENMMLLTRYPYQMPPLEAVSQTPMIRYAPPPSVNQQRLPPPLLRVDHIPETPHSYNKSYEDAKKSYHQSANHLMPHSPYVSTSPHHYQSRTSPLGKESRYPSPPSPKRSPHQSAFTRIHNSIQSEKDIHPMYRDEWQVKKSRIENDIEMIYERRRQSENIANKNYHVTGPQTVAAHAKHYNNKCDMKAPLIDLTCNPATVENNDQPLDLTKKKNAVGDIPDNSHWKNSKLERTFLNDHRPRYQGVHAINEKMPQGIHSDRHMHLQKFSSYPQRTEVTDQTGVAMTPGIMPDQLGSPGVMKPQLHPLPSPNLSTTYTQVHNNLSSPKEFSPVSEKTNHQVIELDNDSRPESQCSISSLDPDADRRGSISRHEPIQNIIGAHPQSDILYLICRLCRQTYGSPYGFRKHFRNQHGFEPRSEHTIVQTISATKTAMQHAPGLTENSPITHRNAQLQGTAPVSNGIFDNFDIPKSRDRASSDSKWKQVNLTDNRSVRPSPVRSAETQKVSKEDGDDTKFLQCEQCKQTFQLNDFGSYKRHCRQHNQARTIGAFHCQMCSSSFQEPHMLEEHILKHNLETIECRFCKIPYGNRFFLEEHLRKVHGKELMVDEESCQYCQLSFTNKKDLLAHIQMVHQHIEETVCSKISSRSGVDHIQHNQVDVQPADQMTTLTCPDSSSDKEQIVENSQGRTSICSGDSRSNSNENSLDTVSSVTNGDNGEENVYKHKKFFNHRKRKESSESATPIKCSKFDDNSAEGTCDSSSAHVSEFDSDLCLQDTDGKLHSKQEARHPMPFVWNRITRSQAGKNIKPPDYMS